MDKKRSQLAIQGLTPGSAPLPLSGDGPTGAEAPQVGLLSKDWHRERGGGVGVMGKRATLKLRGQLSCPTSLNICWIEWGPIHSRNVSSLFLGGWVIRQSSMCAEGGYALQNPAGFMSNPTPFWPSLLLFDIHILTIHVCSFRV